jgi:hypothetical protein
VYSFPPMEKGCPAGMVATPLPAIVGFDPISFCSFWIGRVSGFSVTGSASV